MALFWEASRAGQQQCCVGFLIPRRIASLANEIPTAKRAARCRAPSFSGREFCCRGGRQQQVLRDAVCLFFCVRGRAPFRAHASPHGGKARGQRGAHRAHRFCTDHAAFCALGFLHGQLLDHKNEDDDRLEERSSDPVDRRHTF